MTKSLAVLLVTTVATAVIHMLIPDHWLPFVLVSRSRHWERRRTLALTAGSALVHVSVSVGLGVAAHLLSQGAEAAVGLGASLERASAGLLIIFGLAYSSWFLLRGGHQHYFGMHPHHGPGIKHPPASPHPHDLAGAGRLQATKTPAALGVRGGLALAAIVGFNPCVLIIPYIHLAGSMGLGALILVATVYAASTICCLVGVVMLGLKGTARLESPFLVRYGEAVSGVLIAATGLVALMLGD